MYEPRRHVTMVTVTTRRTGWTGVDCERPARSALAPPRPSGSAGARPVQPARRVDARARSVRTRRWGRRCPTRRAARRRPRRRRPRLQRLLDRVEHVVRCRAAARTSSSSADLGVVALVPQQLAAARPARPRSPGRRAAARSAPPRRRPLVDADDDPLAGVDPLRDAVRRLLDLALLEAPARSPRPRRRCSSTSAISARAAASMSSVIDSTT